MEQPKYIDNAQKLPEALDFTFLRNEGIKYIQKLTGNHWTDYNIHDPGVTILEQLCYGITDLSYRAGLDIEQHLFSGEQDKLPFFRPEETLTNRPLTIEDYRKVFIDAIPEIKNIWFNPVTQFECGFNGLYRILVDVFGIKDGEKSDKKEIVQKIRELFSQTRNLGEDIYEIKILEELPLTIHADIETDGVHELEEILANIYFVVEQLLAPEIKFYSLNELKAKNLGFDEIFNGPKLKHGFILAENLLPQQNTIIISDIVRNIMQIDGVVSVKQLLIEVDGKTYASQYNIPEGRISHIITSGLLTGSDLLKSEINFYKGSLEYKGISVKYFKRHLNELVSENKKSFRISESTIELPSEKGNLDYCDYYSIQNHFPAIYGIGKDGIPGRPDKKRIAKAKQLKGYLLIFEQFMSNYLAQLAHFKDIFSLHRKIGQTYFTQSLDNVPNVTDLLLNDKGNLSDAYLGLEHIPKEYHEGLSQLNKLFDNYTDRRNRFLDFLLAIHGESFSQYALQQFNYYYSDEEFDHHLIRCKNALLQNLGEINYNRQPGFNYLQEHNNKLSGLEKRLAIFLGFEIREGEGNELILPERKSVLKFLEKKNIKLVGEKGKSKAISLWQKEGALKKFGIEPYIIEDKFDYIDDSDLEGLEISSDESEKILNSILPFRIKQIPYNYLLEGLDLSRYKLGKIPGQKAGYLLVYDINGNGQWVSMGDCDSLNGILKAVFVLKEQIVELNIKSENTMMVEHILLRPSPEKEMYGIYINDETGRHILKSEKRYSLEQRLEVLKEIEELIVNKKYYSVEADENRDMNIILHFPKLKLKFRSMDPQTSVEDTHRQKELLHEFLADTRKKASFKEKIGFYIQYSSDSIDIPEKFYSFQMSLIFPAWPARFQNKEFRSVAGDIIIEQIPANVYANIDWLEPEEMIEFEKLFSDWQKALTEQSVTADNDSRFDAISVLANYLYMRSTQEKE